MSVEKAKAHYTAREGHKKLNCGQAVIAAFSQKHALSPEVVEIFASYGAGRAPEGECGALYAAKYILQKAHKAKITDCQKAFIAAAGSTKCKEIRKLNKLPCIGCVEKAAEFLEGI